MSLLTADVMRRALQVCRRGLLQKHLLTPAVASSRRLPAPAPRRTAFYCGHRHFSDAQTQSSPEESTSAVSKPSPEESTAAASKPRPEESTAAASKPRPEESTAAVSKPSPEESTAAVSKPRPEESTSAVSKPRPEESTAAVSKPSPEESTAAASEPRHLSDAQTQSRPEESTSAASKPRPEESTAAASKPRSKKSTSAASKPRPEESTAAASKPRPEESTAAASKPRPEESTAAASKPRSKKSTSAASKPSPEESTAAASKPRHLSDTQTQSRPEESTAAASEPRSVFTDRLASCRSPSDVLDLTLTFSLTPHELSAVLDRMWNSLKKLKMKLRAAELELMKAHAAWNPILQHAMGAASLMSDKDIPYSLLALVRLGMNPNTWVVQIFLREAQERMNRFDDRNLSVLSMALADLEEGANVRELKYAMRLLVEHRLPQINDMLHVRTAMMLVGKDAPPQLKRKLEEKALILLDLFTPRKALRMVCTMADGGFSSKLLLSTCSRKIAEHLPGIRFNSLIAVLLAFKELQFRDLQLLNAVSEYGASMVHVWNHQQVSKLLSSLDSLSFCPESLLDAYSELVQSEPDALTLNQLLRVIRFCSSSNYHSPSLVSCLTSALEKYVQKMSPLELLNTQYHLCIMGHFSAPLLQALLQETTVHQLTTMLTTQPDLKFAPLHLSTVALCLRLEHPDLHQRLPVSSLLLTPPAPPDPHRHSSKPHLSTALQTLMQDRGEWSVSEAERLEGLHFVDAVLTRKPGNGGLEESSAAARSKRVALLCPVGSAFCFRSSRPRGHLALTLRHLRLLGYLPLLVPEEQLLSLSKQQRVNFLQDLIFPGPSSDAASPPPPPGT